MPTLTHKLNRTAIYCRLSRDDGIEESSSITNQKDILEEYATNHSFSIYKYYIDENMSGGNFNRPAFNDMVNDINSGLIDIVLIKDLSRLGRNYIQMGYYLEDFFPSNNIRCIVINDNYDSETGIDEELTPFKNIINQWYLQDISKKIRAVKEIEMKNGEVKTFSLPLYGYYINEKFQRVIDPNTAPIVRRIFKEYIEGKTATEISDGLTKDKIPTPGYYAAMTYGYNKEKYLNAPDSLKYAWPRPKINKIIRNEEYTGTLITKKKEVLSITTKKRAETDPSKRYRFESKFEGIITKETYEAASKIRCNRTFLIREEHPHPLNGLLYHAANNERLYYLTVNKHTQKRTFMNRLHHGKDNHITPIEYNPVRFVERIKKELASIITTLISTKPEFKEYVYQYYEEQKLIKQKEKARLRSSLNKKIQKLEIELQALLEDHILDKIALEEYQTKKEELDSSLKETKSSLEALSKDKITLPKNLAKDLISFMDALSLYKEDPFEEEFLHAFIDKIQLSKTNRYQIKFDIHFKYLDEITRRYLHEKTN